jgi:DNA repair protein RecO (recombination protein O)
LARDWRSTGAETRVLSWSGEALLLGTRRLGEGDCIVELLTDAHGRHAGVVKGGAGRRLAPLLQPGATLLVEWRARLESHIGTARVELVRGRAAGMMADGGRLAALGAATALLRAFLPEREAQPGLHASTTALFDMLEGEAAWLPAYARWELSLLSVLGFGLALDRCAATGATEGLVWVSPRTGRAVSAEAGAPYADRLLALPGFLRGEGAPNEPALREALALTGWFLEHRAAPAFGLDALPAARARLPAALGRHLA